MKKHLLLGLLLFSTVLIACAHTRKTSRKKTPSNSAGTAALRGLTSVMMRRGACFGRCPEYTLTVNSNGMVEYNGTRNTEPLGVYQKNIGTAKAQNLLGRFMAYRADTCSATYHSRVADLPGLSFTLTQNGKQQLIGNANVGPRFLVELSESMDSLVNVDNTWKKIRDVPNGE